jgi:hypothetical protein
MVQATAGHEVGSSIYFCHYRKYFFSSKKKKRFKRKEKERKKHFDLTSLQA